MVKFNFLKYMSFTKKKIKNYLARLNLQLSLDILKFVSSAKQNEENERNCVVM